MHPTVLLLISIGIFILIYAILALSLNFQQGYTGLPNFGLIGFYGIGAYATATIIVNGVNPIVGIILGMVIATIFGVAFLTITGSVDTATSSSVFISSYACIFALQTSSFCSYHLS